MTTIFHHKMRAGVLLVLASAALLSASCRKTISVKEDRSLCPCYLTYDIKSSGYDGPVRLEVFENGGNVYAGDSNTSALSAEGGEETGIPRGEATVTGVGGLDSGQIADDQLLLVPLGEDVDSLYVFSATVDATGEEAVVEGEMLKLFAHVVVDMVPHGTGEYPLRIRVKGNICGYDLRTLEPLVGPNVFIPEPMLVRQNGIEYKENDGMFEFNLPRQADNTLAMEIWGPAGAVSPRPHYAYANAKPLPDGVSLPTSGLPTEFGPGMQLRSTFDLAGYIEKVGYDWSSRSLSADTIYIRIDWSRAEVTIRINDWEIADAIVLEI